MTRRRMHEQLDLRHRVWETGYRTAAWSFWHREHIFYYMPRQSSWT
jgi:hypothetical protein